MATTEWPNLCCQCCQPLGPVSDLQIIVDRSTGEMMHLECCSTPELIAGDDREDGRWLRLKHLNPSQIERVVMAAIQARAGRDVNALWTYLRDRPA